jgi:hypothetical protein
MRRTKKDRIMNLHRVRTVSAPLALLSAAGLLSAPSARAMARPSARLAGHTVGYNPYQRRVGAPIIPASSSNPYPSFATAQGGNPAVVPNPAWMGLRTILPFPSVPLAATIGATGTASTTSQGIFRPSRLIVSVSTDTTPLGNTVAITSILVGSVSQLVNQNAVSAAMFQPNGVETGITFSTAGSGISISIAFSNLVATAATVIPGMIGEYVQGGDHVIAG